MRSVLAIGVLLLSALGPVAGAAAASGGNEPEQPAVVIVESTTLEAIDGEATLTVINLGATPLGIQVAGLQDQADCTPTPDPLEIAAESTAVPRDVTVRLPGCDLSNGPSFTFTFSPIPPDGSGDADVTPVAIDVTIKKSQAASIDQTALGFWFAFGFVVAVILSCAVLIWCSLGGTGRRCCLCRELPEVEGTWSFKDSWASNVTIGASALALFVASSDVMTSLAGPAAEDQLGTVVVGSAIAAALVAISPIAASISQETSKTGEVAGWGLLLGAVFTLTGTIGQLVMLTCVGRDLIGGLLGAAVAVFGAVSFMLVLMYAGSSLCNLLADSKRASVGVPRRSQRRASSL